MARYRHLSKAPVREALIDLRFEPPVPLETVDRFVSKLGDAYVGKTDLWEAVFGMTSDGHATSTHAGHKAIGRRLNSVGKPPYVLQTRTAGFTLSRLSPYGEWRELRDEARRLWETFQKEAGAVFVTRIAVRYVNELNFLLPLGDFAEYLNCPPQVPDALPQSISGFLTRVIIPDPSADCVSMVTQAFEGPPADGPAGMSITVILDIDVSRVTRVRADQADEIWICLDVLRDQKNRMFFEHVTEKTVEMYE